MLKTIETYRIETPRLLRNSSLHHYSSQLTHSPSTQDVYDSYTYVVMVCTHFSISLP